MSVTRALSPGGPLDLRRTLQPLRHGGGDPVMAVDADGIWRGFRTPSGPGTLRVRLVHGLIEGTAWGVGADWLIERLGELCGLGDDTPLVTDNPQLRRLAHAQRGCRFSRGTPVFDVLVPVILGQKVTTRAAHASWRALVRAASEPAPGPRELWLPPAAAVLRGVAYWHYHSLNVERRRADTIRRAASHAGRLEEALELTAPEARARLEAIPGIGPWTSNSVTAVTHGDPDAVPVGDYHLPSAVAWALAGEPRGDDARMLELLEPYRGQRGRVVRLLKSSGARPPRFGPKNAPRDITQM